MAYIGKYPEKTKSIYDFKSQMTSFARPNLFEVEVTPKGNSLVERLNFSCFQASIPGLSIATVDRDKSYRGIAYQKLYEDITLGFYVNSNMEELKIFQKWMELMIRPEDNHVGFYDTYIGTVKIKNLDKQQETVLTTTLHDAYPKSIEAIGLDYGTTDTVMTVSVSMTYRYYTQEFAESKGIDEKIIPSPSIPVVPKVIKVTPEEVIKKEIPAPKPPEDNPENWW